MLCAHSSCVGTLAEAALPRLCACMATCAKLLLSATVSATGVLTSESIHRLSVSHCPVQLSG